MTLSSKLKTEIALGNPSAFAVYRPDIDRVLEVHATEPLAEQAACERKEARGRSFAVVTLDSVDGVE